MKTLKSIFIIFLFLYCLKTDEPKTDFSNQNIKSIEILPLGKIPEKELNIVKNSIESFYGFDCIVLQSVEATSDLLATSRVKYDAKKILRKYQNKSQTLVLTNVNICNKMRGFDEWSILGLGAQPGSICVVSTNRMNKSNVKFKSRLEKVALHEIGHNLGLPHCEFDEKCFMNDAKGTIKTIDNTKIWLCENCCNFIGRTFKPY